jgi:ribonucleoside-diphosphate reductase alpha chain
MGFADTLIKLGIPYMHTDAFLTASKLMSFIREASLKASAALAEERGVFPNYEQSIYPQRNLRIRNATVNTIAPTGTISIIAGCSSGIEPLFALSYVRTVLSGARLFETHPLFEMELRRRGLYSKELMAEVGRVGSLQNIEGVPEDLKKIFITSFDVSPEIHLQIQAAFQKHTDNSVSKTINLASDSTVEDVRDIFTLAHKLKCKGITVYRYGTKKGQVLSFDSRSGGEREEDLNFIMAASEYSGGCHSGQCLF